MSRIPLPPTDGYASYLAAMHMVDGLEMPENADWSTGRDASQPQFPLIEFRKSLDDLDEEADEDADEDDDYDEDEDDSEEEEDEDEPGEDYEDDDDDEEDDDEDEDEEDEDGGVKPLKMLSLLGV